MSRKKQPQLLKTKTKVAIFLLTLIVQMVSVSPAISGTYIVLENYYNSGINKNTITTQPHSDIKSTDLIAIQPTKPVEYSINTMPANIFVPKYDISLPVEIGLYDSKRATWNISDRAAYFAEPSSKLSTQSSQTILYAHNKNTLFGKVRELTKGDEVIITDSQNQRWKYVLRSTKNVDPTNTEVFYEKAVTPTLVLITCDGLFDEKRKLVYFDLIDPISDIKSQISLQ